MQARYPNNIFIETMDVTTDDCVSILAALIQRLQGVDMILYSSGIGTESKIVDYETEHETNKVNVYGFTLLFDYAYI